MAEARAIGCTGQSTFRGCRVGYELVRDQLIIEIRGGSAAKRPSADEPAQFMISRAGLDDLIDHLKEIRVEAAAAELARPWRINQDHAGERANG
jgi:hypothetical protein